MNRRELMKLAGAALVSPLMVKSVGPQKPDHVDDQNPAAILRAIAINKYGIENIDIDSFEVGIAYCEAEAAAPVKAGEMVYWTEDGRVEPGKKWQTATA